MLNSSVNEKPSIYAMQYSNLTLMHVQYAVAIFKLLKVIIMLFSSSPHLFPFELLLLFSFKKGLNNVY